ncbi:hypothetical protein FH972_024331 [Carpinus fangiana]|uniref:Uncharacterized protein n=1 Tax=Carpinus fangiana TaxID=176857 RepID=A0A5N6KYG7_9ROSI|nr:hypothetical protein FH972_024331 [Carpinus fangiana]
MVSIHGSDLACDQCNKKPKNGMLFVCEQDAVIKPVRTASRLRKKLQKGSRRLSSQFELMGFNTSVVQAVSRGFYTADQMEILKRQKLEAREAIETALKNHKESKLRKDSKQPSTNVSPNKPTSSSKLVAVPQPCRIKVCLDCRPMSRARSYISFESVFNGELDAPKGWCRETMPVANASICRNFPTSSSVEEASAMPHKATNKESPSNQLKETPSSVGFRDSIRRGYNELLQENLDSESLEAHAESHLQCDRTTKSPRSIYELDLLLWKTLMNEVLELAAATQLPDEPSDDELYDDQSSTTSEEEASDWTGTPLSMIMEEEAEDSGVELMDDTEDDIIDQFHGNARVGPEVTEEAVQTHIPDMIISAY